MENDYTDLDIEDLQPGNEDGEDSQLGDIAEHDHACHPATL